MAIAIDYLVKPGDTKKSGPGLWRGLRGRHAAQPHQNILPAYRAMGKGHAETLARPLPTAAGGVCAQG